MSDSTNENLRLQDAIERTLSDKAASEPGFLERAVIDPRGVVGPIIAELAGDDGDLDLSGTAVNIHVQTPEALHFVMAAPAAETSGFKLGGFDLGLMDMRVDMNAKTGDKITKSEKANDARCHTSKTSTCISCTDDDAKLRAW